jgi:hypothetical protein
MERAGESGPALTARNVVSERTDARTSTTGRPHVVWLAAGSASAAVTGGLLAAHYIASAIGWSLEGRSPGSEWLGIVMGVVVGGIVGGIGFGIQHRASIPRIGAPLIAVALLVLLGIIVWVVLIPFDPNGSLRYGVAVIAPLVTIATVLATAIVALTNSALWLRVGGVASALVAASLVIGLLAGA